jgi:hypothetical protein
MLVHACAMQCVACRQLRQCDACLAGCQGLYRTLSLSGITINVTPICMHFLCCHGMSNVKHAESTCEA